MFKIFLENIEDIEKTLNKIPKEHADLIRGYKIKFEPNNSLQGDDQHIGIIDEKEKTITIAAPWNYSREYTLLHEIAHAVWKFIVSKEKKTEWSDLLKKTKTNKEIKKNLDQNDEEIFCMVYAQHYAKNKLTKYDYQKLENFISKI